MNAILDTTSQYKHDLLVSMTADEEARQEFVKSFKLYLAQNISPGNKKVFDEAAAPVVKEKAGTPKSLAEIDKIMKAQPYYQFWSSLQRASQEMMWNSVRIPVQRQIGELVEKAKEKKVDALG